MLGRDLVMVPKLIHPLPPNMPGTPKSPAYGEPIEEEPPTPHPMTDTWMQVVHAFRTNPSAVLVTPTMLVDVSVRSIHCLLLALLAYSVVLSASHTCD